MTVQPSPPRIRLADDHEMPQLLAIDDDATRFYASIGFPLQLPSDAPFIVEEQSRWARALKNDRVFIAEDVADNANPAPIGIAVLDLLGDEREPYLDQLSVRMASMQRGVGTALIDAAVSWARAQRGSRLWITTYSHLAHNRPFYERRGFHRVAEAHCPAGVVHHLDAQRRALPAPEHRIAMCRLVTSETAHATSASTQVPPGTPPHNR
jgi:N-acetylglutamate synthase-like GNAT family acetyltransferase